MASGRDRSGSGSTVILIGVAIAALGLVGAVVMFADMSGDSFADIEYSVIEKWLAVLAGLTVAGLGAILAALGAILTRLDPPVSAVTTSSDQGPET